MENPFTYRNVRFVTLSGISGKHDDTVLDLKPGAGTVKPMYDHLISKGLVLLDGSVTFDVVRGNTL